MANGAAPPPAGAQTFWGWLVSPAALLAILTAINFLNYVDRLIIFTLSPYLARDLGLSKTQLGLLVSAFVWVHAIATVPVGFLADRWMRKSVIVIGVALWSVATTLGAWANGFRALYVCRALVGLGEATYAPAATALISERTPPERRARALAVFNLGLALGAACGMGLGGILGDKLGWRATFFVVGAPGLLLAGLALLIHEPRRRRGSEWLVPALELPVVPMRKRPLLLAIFGGGTLVTFFTWGLVFAVQHMMVDEHAIAPSEMGMFMTIAGVALAAGMWLGGQIGDRSLRWHPGGRLLTGGIGVLASLPFVLACVWAPSRSVLIASLLFVMLFLPWYTSPVLAALCDAVGEKYRATYSAAYFLIIHLLGDALSPPMVGYIADRTGSIRHGLLALTVFGLAGGLWLLRGATHLRREQAAPTER